MGRSRFVWTVLTAVASTATSLPSISAKAQSAMQGQEHVTAAVQDALAWTGHFDLLYDGETGPKTLAATSAFQRQQGWPVTGALDDAQTVRLLEIANSLRARAGFREVTDRRSGVTIGLPLAFVSYSSDTPNGSRYRSRDGQIELRLVRYDAREKPLRALYEEVRGQFSSENRHLNVVFSDRFFVSATSDKRVFYFSARQFGGDVKGFTFSYPPEIGSVVGPIIVAMGNSLKAPILDYAAVARLISSRPSPPVAAVDPAAKAPAVAGCEQRSGHQYFSVSNSVSGGVLNMRSGPGIGHPIVAAMPSGSCGVKWLGQCENPQGASAQWCRVEWSGHVGWASMSGLVRDQLVAPPQQTASASPIPNASAKKSGGTGTGFAVSHQGHILTNSHVVTNCSEIVVLQPGGQQHKALVAARDRTNDLALLQSTAKPEDVASFRSGVRVGEAIAAYGFPYAGLLPSTGNFTTGTVTASAGLRDDSRMVQISSPVQPGNSGGPLVDQAGNVVGVIVSKLDALLVASITDDVPQNVNFAIKSGIATTFLEANRVDFRTAAAQTQLSGADLADRSRRMTWFVACLPQQ